MTDLFTPLEVGSLTLPNRIIMAPLTRGRATEDGTPTEKMVRYYRDRAGAGLIISEATGITVEGRGWPHCPGIFTAEHVSQWRKVTDAVHETGGRMVLQLWHMGRIVHPHMLNGKPPVSSSAVRCQAKVKSSSGDLDYETPRALEVDELPRVAQDYARAAQHAIEAGFDGVEIHGANGYLLDQFIRDGVNQRTDDYGGSVENRWRFPLEVVDAVVKVAGAERTGIRFSPQSPVQDMEDSNPRETFAYGAEALEQRGIGYIHIIDPVPGHSMSDDSPPIRDVFRRLYHGPLLINGGYDKQSGTRLLQQDEADAIVYGVPFIANPDLVQRFHEDAPLNKPRPKFFYTQGEEGYNDYPIMDEVEAA